MNTLQMKQKMFELGVSDKYMADACGVGLVYFRCVFNGSRPMTGKLKQKIEHVFHSILTNPKSAEQPKQEVVQQKKQEEENRKCKIEYYRGRVEGLFSTLGVMESIVASEERTYSQGFVEMFCGIQQKLCKSVFELLDLLDKKEG